ncbi:MAG: hypothetical protein ACKOEM_11175, partial [Planctomycetia bacterium]
MRPADEAQASGARGRSGRGSRSSGGSLGRHAFRDHGLAAASAAGATADNLTAAAAATASFAAGAAVRSDLTARTALFDHCLAVATGSLLGAVVGEQTAVATLTVVAAMATVA